MMHVYSAFICITAHPKSFTIISGDLSSGDWLKQTTWFSIKYDHPRREKKAFIL